MSIHSFSCSLFGNDDDNDDDIYPHPQILCDLTILQPMRFVLWSPHPYQTSQSGWVVKTGGY